MLVAFLVECFGCFYVLVALLVDCFGCFYVSVALLVECFGYPRASSSPAALAGRTGEMGRTKKNSI